jgi:hypothetical protein
MAPYSTNFFQNVIFTSYYVAEIDKSLPKIEVFDFLQNLIFLMLSF